MAPFEARSKLIHTHLGIPYELHVPFGAVAVWGFVEGKLAFVLQQGGMAAARALIMAWIEELLAGRERPTTIYPCLN
jgi:hypothetical protein